MKINTVFKNGFFLVIVSGVLTGISSNYLIVFPALIALVPLFLALENKTPRRSFLLGFVSGITFGLVSCTWMISLVQRYTGSGTYIGVLLTILSALFMGLHLGLFSFIYSYLNSKIVTKSKFSSIKLIIIAASVWVILEWLKTILVSGMPWLSFSLAATHARWIYALQLSSLTGPWGVSFIVVAVNILIAYAIIEKKMKYLYGAGILYFLNIIYGFAALQLNDPQQNGTRFKASVICENVSAERRWQKENGDSLASVFIDLNTRAAKLKPDLIVWSETALPWTFSADDDLIKIALNKTYSSKSTHLIGMLTDVPGRKGYVYNSVYTIDYDGRVVSRYDKYELLSLLEKPLFDTELFNSILPFFTDIGYRNALKGRGAFPVYTPFGMAGILICNESVTTFNARESSANNAEFLVNISNDAWFENTFISDQHFLCARLRAIENRKYIIINSNRGISGIINSNGEILSKKEAKESALLSNYVYTHYEKTIYTKFGDWFIYLMFCFCLFPILKSNKTKPASTNIRDIKNKKTKNKKKFT